MSEALPQHEQMLKYLDYGLNHERKIGTLAVVHTFDTEEFDTPLSFTITNLLNRRQGLEPVWRTSPGSVAKYLEECFIPGNLVTTVEHRIGAKRMTKAYYPNAENSDLIGALAGMGMEWSLDNPHFSVQQLLGVTATSGQTRAPSGRFKICKRLLEPRDWVRSDLVKLSGEFGYKTSEEMYTQFLLMREIGLVVIESGSSRIQLTPEVIGPIREFCASIDAVLSGSESDAYNKKLEKLAHDKTAFARLIAKGKEFSNQHAAYVDGNEIMMHISETLPQLIEASQTGMVTVGELRADILANYGRKIGTNGLRVILARMREQNLLEAELVSIGTKHYYLTGSHRNSLDIKAKQALAEQIESRRVTAEKRKHEQALRERKRALQQRTELAAESFLGKLTESLKRLVRESDNAKLQSELKQELKSENVLTFKKAAYFATAINRTVESLLEG